MKVSVVADNVTCDQASDYAVRFQGLVPVSSGSGSVNGSFAVGSPLASPILAQVLPLSKFEDNCGAGDVELTVCLVGLLNPIDLVLKFF